MKAFPLVWHLVCASGDQAEGDYIDAHGSLTRMKGVLEGWHGFPNPKSFNCQFSRAIITGGPGMENWIDKTEEARKTGFDPKTEEARSTEFDYMD